MAVEVTSKFPVKWELGGLLLAAGLMSITACGGEKFDPYREGYRPPSSDAPIDLVDPFIATADDHGQQHPAAMVPFGMVKLGPDTWPGAVENTSNSGYNFNEHRLLGFSHLRVGGMGAGGIGGNLLVVPRTGRVRLEPGRYTVTMDKETEAASPGYYSVMLDNGIHGEMTAGTRIGVHRYTFPPNREAHLLVDLSRALTSVRHSELQVEPSGGFSGRIDTRHRFNPKVDYTLFFAGSFTVPPTRHALWKDGAISGSEYTLDGGKIGALFFFEPPHHGPIELAIAFSTIDVEAARETLQADLPAGGFDVVHQQARSAWEDVLGRISIEGGSVGDRRLFYTSLYRSHGEPMIAQGPDGRYRSHDLEVRHAADWTFLDGWTTWDTFRTKFPLLVLLQPDMMENIIRSIADNFAHTSRGTYPFLMVRFDMTAPVLLDAWRKGIRGFDIDLVYRELKRNAIHQAHPRWEELGYFPERPDLTLEHAYFDWCVAELAADLGLGEDEKRFRNSAAFYHNTWNPETGFFQPRREDGSWVDLPDPDAYYPRNYYEGTPWHWRWFVPHDPVGLMELLGGRDAMVWELEYYFDNDLHNMGNQVGLKVPWIYSEAGRPDLTRDIVTRLLTGEMNHRFDTHHHYPRPLFRRAFQATPDGFLKGMDDDAGTMSTWYVWAALGLYPITPGIPKYALGAPLFERARIHLPNGGEFVIERGAETITRVLLNGELYEDPFLSHEAVVRGGVLRFE